MRTIHFVANSDGLRLPGATVVPEQPRAHVLLLHGTPSGRPQDPSDPDRGYPGLAEELAGYGFAASWVDLRGVRQAEGNFSIRGWEADVHAVLDELKTHDAVDSLPVVLVGASASGPTVLRVAAERSDVAAVATLAGVATWMDPGFIAEPETLILEFRSIGLIRDPNFPANTQLWFREFERDGVQVIGKIAPRPVLIMHGEGDPVVPYHHAELLYQAGGSGKELIRIPGGGHQLRRDPAAITALRVWLDDLAANHV